LRFGADFGLRAPAGAFSNYGLKMVEASSGRRVLNDVHGAMVFECEPEPLFAKLGARATVGKPPDRLLRLVKAASEADVTMSEREILAFDLF
jgi:hypothetical protein